MICLASDAQKPRPLTVQDFLKRKAVLKGEELNSFFQIEHKVNQVSISSTVNRLITFIHSVSKTTYWGSQKAGASTQAEGIWIWSVKHALLEYICIIFKIWSKMHLLQSRVLMIDWLNMDWFLFLVLSTDPGSVISVVVHCLHVLMLLLIVITWFVFRYLWHFFNFGKSFTIRSFSFYFTYNHKVKNIKCRNYCMVHAK